MTDTKEIIIELKKARKAKGLSYGNILNLMEQHNNYMSKSTISRVFSDGSENLSFRYDDTIKPLADVLLTDEPDNYTDYLKTQIELKDKRIDQLLKIMSEYNDLIENIIHCLCNKE